MAYDIKKTDGKFYVYQTTDNSEIACYDTRGDAVEQLRALYANEVDKNSVEEAVRYLKLAATENTQEEILAQIKRALEELNEETMDLTTEEEEFLGDSYVFADSMKEYQWAGPIVFEDVTTGDNRIFKANSINWDPDTLPWAFRWQRASGQGHAGSVPVGRVDRIERKEDGAIYGYGVVIPELNEEAAEYLRLLESGVGSGVSVDGDSAQFDIQEGAEKGSQPRVEFSSMRLRALSAVDIPAFNGARIKLIGQDTPDATEVSAALSLDDVENEVEVEKDIDNEFALMREAIAKKKEKIGWNIDEALVAAAIPTLPPTEWFVDPEFDSPTPLTVTKDGRVSGYLALFNTCHIGFPGTCVKPPKGSKYQYFHTGEIETAEGDLVQVGRLTFKTGHADMNASPRIAAEHYDNTGTVAADVRAGEDKHGIWVVGALRPHLSDEDVRAFRSAPLSGDWRRIAGKLELVGALGVNTPGFPVPRVKAMVASGETETLFTYLEGDDEEFCSDYELTLRQDRKIALASTIEKSFAMDTQVSDGKIVEEAPKVLTKAEYEARGKNYTKNQVFADLKLVRELLDDPEEKMPKKVRDGLESLYKAFVIVGENGKKFTVSGYDLDIIDASGLEIEEWEAQLEFSGLSVIEFYNQCHDKGGKFCEGKDGPGRVRDVVKGRHFVENAKPGTSEHGSDVEGESPEAHAKKDKSAGGHGYKQDPHKKGDPKKGDDPKNKNPSVNHKTYENFRQARQYALRWTAAATIALAALASPLSGVLQGIATTAGLALIGSPAILGLVFFVGSGYAAKNALAARRHRTDYNQQVDKKIKFDKYTAAENRRRQRIFNGP